mmetsp:Transcript_44225/g.70686  ORF Transcript_44225/g.70686 Transcript_44225/m.70686 type:complete len:701 (+) Transcript_44225:2640-4742(+)
MNTEGRAPQANHGTAMFNLSARQRVVKEMFETEKSYLNNLKLLVKLYVGPLRLDARGINPMLELNDVHSLFANVEAVLRISEKLFGDMESYVAQGALDDNVGKVFCEVSPLLKLYTAYVNSHHRALETHRMLLEQQSYREFCDRCKALPESQSCSLDSFLILPVQRVPRYELLIKELLKHTDEDHPEYTIISSAYSKVSTVAKMINSNLRDHERRTAVLAVQEKFGNSVQLVSPQRWFIREATLRKVCKRKPKPFRFVLFNDVLIYGSLVSMSGFNVNRTTPKQQHYKYHRTIDLVNAEVCVCPDSPLGEPQFQISSTVKSFKVITCTEAERDQWVRDLEENIAEALRVNESRANACSFEGLLTPSPNPARVSSSFLDMTSLDYAPVRDCGAGVDSCSICTAEFSYLKRRHQCRRCGIIVCDKCSPHRWRLRNLNRNKLKRICHNCFAQLTEGVYGSFGGLDDCGSQFAGMRRHGSVPVLPSPTEPEPFSPTRSMSLDFNEISPPFDDGLSTDDTKSSISSDISSQENSNHLPRNWREARDSNGELYYWNTETKEVSWERPTECPPVYEHEEEPANLPPTPPPRPASMYNILIPESQPSSQHVEVKDDDQTPPPLPPKPRKGIRQSSKPAPKLPPRLPRRHSVAGGELLSPTKPNDENCAVNSCSFSAEKPRVPPRTRALQKVPTMATRPVLIQKPIPGV